MANDRNAGRKPILNAVKITFKIPKQHLQELIAFAKSLQYKE